MAQKWPKIAKIAQNWPKMAQKLAPAKKNSRDTSPVSPTFCISVRGGVLALSPLSSATGGQAPHWPQLQYPQPFIFQHEPFNSCLKIFSVGREGKRSTLHGLL